MEKRAIIAVALSLLILIAYQRRLPHFYPAPPPLEKQPEQVGKPPEEPKTVDQPAAAKPGDELKTAKPGPKAQPAREIKVETDDYIALFTSQGARLKSFKLKRYRGSLDGKSPPFEMVPTVPGLPYPLGVQVRGDAPFNDESVSYSAQGGDLNLSGTSQGRLVFQGQTPAGAGITKEFSFSGSGYQVGMQASVAGQGPPAAPDVVLTSAVTPSGPVANPPAESGLVCSVLRYLFVPKADAAFEGVLAQVNGKLVREHVDSVTKKEWVGPVDWAGFGHTYFLFAVLPPAGAEQKMSAHGVGPGVALEIEPAAGASGKAVYNLFIGPKELDILKSMGRGMERSIDFGHFYFISIPLLYVLHFFHNFTASYGLVIILLTVLIKLLLAPLTHKSFVSMKQMQKLQPQMERLKEKYKDDKEGLNKEIMELYRRNKVNPFGGCLPMLLQFPVFIGLYSALLTPIELRHAQFLWIKDLSRPDWESLPIHLAGCHAGIPILTLLMGGSMLAQQWMTPSAGDPNQRRMMLMMPLIFTFMFINFPSGLTIYWLVNNLLSIAQQYLINRTQK